MTKIMLKLIFRVLNVSFSTFQRARLPFTSFSTLSSFTSKSVNQQKYFSITAKTRHNQVFLITAGTAVMVCHLKIKNAL